LIDRFGRDESGATATEYAVLIVFVALAIAVGANLLGNDLSVLSIEPDRRQVLVDELAR